MVGVFMEYLIPNNPIREHQPNTMTNIFQMGWNHQLVRGTTPQMSLDQRYLRSKDYPRVIEIPFSSSRKVGLLRPVNRWAMGDGSFSGLLLPEKKTQHSLIFFGWFAICKTWCFRNVAKKKRVFFTKVNDINKGNGSCRIHVNTCTAYTVSYNVSNEKTLVV